SGVTDALCGHAHALEQQKQFVCKQFRLRQVGSRAQLDDSMTLGVLEGFDHAPRGMILFRQLDRGIRQRASALIPASDTAGQARSCARGSPGCCAASLSHDALAFSAKRRRYSATSSSFEAKCRYSVILLVPAASAMESTPTALIPRR